MTTSTSSPTISVFTIGAFGESDGMNFAPSPSTSPVTYGFAGMIYDEESGLYASHGARKDYPTIGRWLSVDPIGFAGGDTNLNRYVPNSPEGFTDPSGLLIVNRTGSPYFCRNVIRSPSCIIAS